LWFNLFGTLNCSLKQRVIAIIFLRNMSTGVDRQTEVTVLVAVVQNDTVIHANMSTG